MAPTLTPARPRSLAPLTMLLGLALAACSDEETGGWESFDGQDDEIGTSEEDTTESSSTDSGEEESTEEETDTGDTGPVESTRYLVAATDDALLLGVDLDDPLDVPEPEAIITGPGATGLFGATPFGTHMLSHEGGIDQIGLSDVGEYTFAPLLDEPATWMDHVYFGLGAANAVASVGAQAFGVGNQLWWLEYDALGGLTQSSNITPPLEANGSVMVLGRSPDASVAAVLVDAEADSLWHLYALDVDPEPQDAPYIDVIDFTGLPPTGVADFLWLHVDDTRIVYRKEGQPGIFRPLAVDLDDPDVNRVNLTPSLGHISSLVWSPDNTRVLVTTGGADGYRELYLVELEGPTMAQTPLLISEPGMDALVDTGVGFEFATLGHGFDGFNRIWYAYTDANLAEAASVGIQMVVVVEGEIAQRTELTEVGPGVEVDDVRFDAARQLLGYRSQTADLSSIHYIDMAEAPPESIRIDQDFAHSAGAPQDDATFAWSSAGDTIAVVGVQGSITSLHVATIGEATGSTTLVALPDVETAGVTLDHAPHLSPDGEHVILWYRVTDGRTGLVHAPTDGSGEGKIVLGADYELRDGAYLSHTPE